MVTKKQKARFISSPPVKKVILSDAVLAVIIKQKMTEQIKNLGDTFNIRTFISEIQTEYRVSANLCHQFYGGILNAEACKLRKQANANNSVWY